MPSRARPRLPARIISGCADQLVNSRPIRHISRKLIRVGRVDRRVTEAPANIGGADGVSLRGSRQAAAISRALLVIGLQFR